MHTPGRETTAAEDFERAFALAVLRSERRRALILGLLLVLIGVVVGVVWSASPEAFRDAGLPVRARALSGGLLIVGVLYEGLTWWWLGRLQAAGRGASWVWTRLNVLIEVSLPTMALVLFTTAMHPAEALSSPPSYGYLVLIPLFILQLKPLVCLLAGVVSALQYGALVLYFTPALQAWQPGGLLGLPQMHIIKVIILVIAGAGAGLVAYELRGQVAQSLRLVRERDRVTALFGQHVSPEVARALMEGQGGQTSLRVAVLFLDIRGFTRFSEGRDAEEVVSTLNALLTPLMDVVPAHGGVVNKLLGDGFMAVFGAPVADPEAGVAAVRAAHEMLARVDRLVTQGAVPPLRVGIGVHLGPASTGLVGEGARREYTVIGDTVNLAARIEGLCKPLEAQLLVSEAVFETLPEGLRGEASLREAEVRGREEPVQVARLA